MYMMNTIKTGKDVMVAAKKAFAEIKGLTTATESKIIVQFQNCKTYQYRCDATGISKVVDLNMDEVLMVQLAVGTTKVSGKYANFHPEVIKMIYYKDLFQKGSETDTTPQEDVFTWE